MGLATFPRASVIYYSALEQEKHKSLEKTCTTPVSDSRSFLTSIHCVHDCNQVRSHMSFVDSFISAS